MSRLRSSRYLLEAPMGIRMVLAVRKHLQITNMIILDNFGLKNCLKKFSPWGCPGSGPPGTCWRLQRWSGPEIRKCVHQVVIWGPRAFQRYLKHDPTTSGLHISSGQLPNIIYFLLFRKNPAKGRGLVTTHQLVLIIACRHTQVWQAAQLSDWLRFFVLQSGCRIACMLHKVTWHVIMVFSNWGVKQCPMQDFFNTFMTKFDISNAVLNDRSPRLASTSTLCRIF